MAFEDRKIKAQSASELFISYLKVSGCEYAHLGYENLTASKGFMEKMKESESGKLIRYLPDFIIYSNKYKKVMLVDTKNGFTIEKESYDTYIKLVDAGFMVYIAVLYEGILYFGDVKFIQFKRANEGIIPTTGGMWFEPRKMNKEDYEKWKMNNDKSGTSFGIIDFQNSEFKKISNGKIEKHNS